MPLVFGTLVHSCLEEFYKGNFIHEGLITEWEEGMSKKLSECEQEGLQDQVSFDEEAIEKASELARSMMSRYIDKYQGDMGDWVILGTEVVFDIPLSNTLAPGWRLTGAIDLLVYEPSSNRIIVIDHKTTAAYSPQAAKRTYEMSPQSWAYLYAIRTAMYSDSDDISISVDRNKLAEFKDKAPQIGFLYNFLRKKIPSVPKVLKNGTISKASCDTTYKVFTNALRDANQVFTDYEDQLAMLSKKGDAFLFRVDTQPQSSVIEQWLSDAVAVTKEIDAGHEANAWRRSTNQCNPLGRRCEFLDICVDPYGGIDDEERIQLMFNEIGGEGPVEIQQESTSGIAPAPF